MLDGKSCILVRLPLLSLMVVCLGTAVSHSAKAQSGVGILPPTVSARDVNGVDLIGGSLTVPMSTLAAGSNGSGISRTGLGYNPITDNLSGTITAGFYNGDKYNGMVNVSVNGTSEWFYFPQWTTADNVNFIDGYGKSEETGYDCSPQVAGSPDGQGFGYDEYFTHCQLNGQASEYTATTLNCTGSTCTFVMRDGSVATFLRTHMGPRMLGLQGNYGRITKLVKPDGEVLEYSYWHLYITQNAYPISINMNALSPLQVTSSLGWTVRYQYQSSFGPPPPEKIAIVNATLDYCDPTANRCAAADQATSPYLSGQGFYPNSGQSIGVTAGNTNPWQTWYVSGYSSPAGGSVSTTLFPTHTGTNAFWYWDNDNKVKTLTRNGKTWSYAYSLPSGSGISTTTVTNPDNTKRYLKFLGHPRPSSYRYVPVESVEDELGRTTKYVFARPPYIGKVISPEATYSGSTLTGGYTQYDYDSRWNPTQSKTYPEGGGTPITASAVYPATCTNRVTCNKPTSVTDANGNTTTFTYDAVHGGILTETGPAVNGVQPQKRYSYSQITPRLKSATGTMVAQPPVWRLTGTSVCKTMTLATCVGTSDEIKTTISYGSDNTNPVYKNVLPVSVTTLGGGGLSTTISYTYDNFGHVTSEKGPRTDVDDTRYTTYDLYGRPRLKISADPDGSGPLRRQATRTTYDPEGRVLQVEAGTANTTSGSDFTAASYVLNTYDTTSGMPTKTQTVVLP
ncbi:hypothetical protein [Asticcacaulis sp. AC460]|uniref:hypothetical protein n=1 Tax=Asticcacaulis sp. AC460 TaxID=1282360 RepID=UPI00040C8AC5|nr:hypothetical protein [Asticcacaulis sp. AC460]